LWEDCADLESDVYDVPQKLLILQRMYRTQPALLAAGPPGRTRHDELGSGMQIVGDSLSRGSSRHLAGFACGSGGGAVGGRSRSKGSIRFAVGQG
jgi:hypothetical protein